ncbi:unnamed protein product [Lathyrus sativus]|nr:unnamed protein product [Lathyrus sativus]
MGEDPNQTLIDEVQDELANKRDVQEGHQDHREENGDMISGEPIRDNVVDMEASLKRSRKLKSLETCNWTTAMDEVLLDEYFNQQTLENKNGNSMTTSVMDSILKDLKIHFPDKPISKEKIKDHMKHIKTKFNSCYDLFHNGLSGFGWDSTTNMWIIEDEVWNKLIEAKPEAAEWKNKPILFYDKLAKHFGKDRATGEHEGTNAEMRAKKAANVEKSHGTIIEEINHLVETNEVILEGFDDDEHHSNNTPTRPSITNSQDVSSSRTKKRVKKVIEDDTSMTEISKTFKTMVDVFEMNFMELVKQSKNANVGDTWAELVEIGVEPSSLPLVYMYLIKNVDALKAFNGIPIDKRKKMLHVIVLDYPF